jgi:guanylate kinase
MSSFTSAEPTTSAARPADNLRRPIVVAGPSGVGKSTLLGRLFKEFPDRFGFSVSHTTRAPRPGEQNGVHYHFVSRDEMMRGVANGEFIESAEYSGNLYGTSKRAVREVAEKGKTCVLDIDMQGVLSIKKTDLNARYVFIVPPSFEELERRLRSRGDTAEDAIRRRLEQARWELSFRDKEAFWDRVIVNDDIERAYAEFRQFCLNETS